jgi:hypothetical protein
MEQVIPISGNSTSTAAKKRVLFSCVVGDEDLYSGNPVSGCKP